MSAYSASKRGRGSTSFGGAKSLRLGLAGGMLAGMVCVSGCGGAATSPLFEEGDASTGTPTIEAAAPGAEAGTTTTESGAPAAPFVCGVETCVANEFCRTTGAESTCREIPFACRATPTCACVLANVQGGGQGPGGPGQGCNNPTCDDTNGQIRLTCM